MEKSAELLENAKPKTSNKGKTPNPFYCQVCGQKIWKWLNYHTKTCSCKCRMKLCRLKAENRLKYPHVYKKKSVTRGGLMEEKLRIISKRVENLAAQIDTNKRNINHITLVLNQIFQDIKEIKQKR